MDSKRLDDFTGTLNDFLRMLELRLAGIQRQMETGKHTQAQHQLAVLNDTLAASRETLDNTLADIATRQAATPQQTTGKQNVWFLIEKEEDDER